MTADSSQGAPPPQAPQAPQAPQSAPAASQSSGNQTMRIAILVVVAAIVGVGLWLVLGRDSKHNRGNGGANNIVKPIGPRLETQNNLGSLALLTKQPIYWAGPKRGLRYEFTRLGNDWIYVRYLPKGAQVGNQSAKYLTVSTYPFFNAYNRLKKGSKNKGVDGPNHSYIWQRPNHPTSVLIAWPNVNYEVEVYHPNAAKAASIAESGQVSRVG